jgi:outer membrane biosynthesis protein TonB
VEEAPVGEEPAPAEQPVEEAPVGEEPAPAEQPVEEAPVSEEPAPAEPPVEEAPVSEEPAPAEPPVEQAPPVSDPTSAEPPLEAAGRGVPIVVEHASGGSSSDAALAILLSDSSGERVIGGEGSGLRSDRQGNKRDSPSARDPGRPPPGPQAPAPASGGASGGLGGGFSGALLAALVGFFSLALPGLGGVLRLSLTRLRPPALATSLERPD